MTKPSRTDKRIRVGNELVSKYQLKTLYENDDVGAPDGGISNNAAPISTAPKLAHFTTENPAAQRHRPPAGRWLRTGPSP